MDKQDEIKKLRADSEWCWNLKKKLVRDEGIPLDHYIIKELEAKISTLMIKIHLLTDKSPKDKRRFYRALGINQN